MVGVMCYDKHGDVTTRMPEVAPLLIADAGIPVQVDRWLQVYESWPQREVFAHPEYVRLFARPCDRVSCAIMQTATGGVLFPFILRPLAKEPWSNPEESAMDLISPYGYGGPFAWGCTEEAEKLFWQGFGVWAKENQVVCAFLRLSLFPSERLRPPFGERFCLSNVIRNLDLDEVALLKDYDRKVPQNVHRAIEQGLKFEVDWTAKRLDDFLHVYYSTLERRQAEESYYFPKEFFLRFCEQLPGRYAFLHVLDGASVVSTELVLLSARRMYSFLGGTLREAFPKRPNDFLKHQAALFGRSIGKSEYVLGGGHRGDDSLYHYKKSFAPHGSVPFHVCEMILDPENHQRLVGQRQSWEASQLVDWTPQPGYFPQYRG